MNKCFWWRREKVPHINDRFAASPQGAAGRQRPVTAGVEEPKTPICTLAPLTGQFHHDLTPSQVLLGGDGWLVKLSLEKASNLHQKTV